MDEAAFTYAEPDDPLWKRLAIGVVEKATGRDQIKRLYFQHQRQGWSDTGFFVAAIQALSLHLQYDSDRLEALPKTGALIVVANHPFGVLDGIVMCALMEKVRRDFLVLTNAVLLRAPEMREYMIPVDFTGTPEAQRTNIETRARARSHLAEGGCVVIFPAGGVSTSPDFLGRKAAVDAPWTPFLAALTRQARAPVAPIFFPGQNSRLFQIVSHISLTLRLSLFFYELRRRINTDFPIKIGPTIPFADLAHLTDRGALVAELRKRVYALQPRPR